jgi:two-component system, cell cycle sensor histidine kinase and response regulator CckA
MSPDVLLLLDSDELNPPAPWEPEPWAQPKPVPEPRTARILIVDDDSVVRALLQRVLTNAGYTVTTAAHGAEALEAVLGAGQTIDLAITDIRMPHMDGWELGRRLSHHRPGLPILYLSGFTSELSRFSPAGTQAAGFLSKPFDPDELLRRVALLLE